ncbi:MAG: homoserine dehydrogenase [Pseudomonadota bacterium]
MASPLRLGIAGLGTVGAGVVKIVQRHRKLLRARAGRDVVIAAVCARSRDKDRGVRLSDYMWEDDPIALAKRDDVDVFVELVGGENGPAKDAVEAAIASGKDVVTANKALLAHHGQALALAAEERKTVIRFEAAVAGGIPIVKALAEGLAGHEITRIGGVINGTCNYILTRMRSAGLSYESVFQQARDLGYLEADPRLDVDGVDTGHKLALLSAIAFGTRVDFGNVTLEGIGSITIEDITQAADMGYVIKLLGLAQITEQGLEQRVSPCLVPAGSPLGQLEGSTNMIMLEGDSVGRITLRGAGAGEGPTASAVMSDVMDIARGVRLTTFGQSISTLRAVPPAPAPAPAPYYLRMTLQDEPGALAKVTTALANSGLSINRMRQYRHSGRHAPVLIVTHRAAGPDLMQVLNAITATGVAVGAPVVLRIEDD